MEASEKTRQEVLEILEKYRAGFLDQNVDLILSLFDKGSGATVISPERQDKIVGEEAIRSHYNRAKGESPSVRLEFKDMSVCEEGSVAWVSGNTYVRWITDDGKIDIALQFSGVLIHREGKWMIVQAHTSIPFESEPVPVE